MGKSKAEDLLFKAFTDSGKIGYYMLYSAVRNAGRKNDQDTQSRLPE